MIYRPEAASLETSPETPGEASPENPLDTKKEKLRQSFLERLAENLRNEHLTVAQLERMIERSKHALDVDPVRFLVDVMDGGGNSMASDTYGLRGQRLTYSVKDRSFSDLVEETFEEVHRPTLKSSLPRHNDGLTYRDIGLSVPDVKDVLRRVHQEITELQDNDVEQNYDKKILASFVEDIDYQSTRSLFWFFELHTHERFGEVMAMKIKDLPKLFIYQKGYKDHEIHSIEWSHAEPTIKQIIDTLGEDVSELPAEELYRLVKNKVEKWDKEVKDKAAMKAFDPQI